MILLLSIQTSKNMCCPINVTISGQQIVEKEMFRASGNSFRSVKINKIVFSFHLLIFSHISWYTQAITDRLHVSKNTHTYLYTHS